MGVAIEISVYSKHRYWVSQALLLFFSSIWISEGFFLHFNERLHALDCERARSLLLLSGGLKEGDPLNYNLVQWDSSINGDWEGIFYGRVVEPLLWRLRACLICRTGHRPFAVVWRRDCFRAGWWRRPSSCGFSFALWLGLLAFCWRLILEEADAAAEVV